jgi:hypothetical protein
VILKKYSPNIAGRTHHKMHHFEVSRSPYELHKNKKQKCFWVKMEIPTLILNIQ